MIVSACWMEDVEEESRAFRNAAVCSTSKCALHLLWSGIFVCKRRGKEESIMYNHPQHN